MKTLYFDCGMGAAGDMLTAALTELMPEPDEFIERLNSIGIPDVEFTAERTSKSGIMGTHVTVSVHGVTEGHEDHDDRNDYFIVSLGLSDDRRKKCFDSASDFQYFKSTAESCVLRRSVSSGRVTGLSPSS